MRKIFKPDRKPLIGLDIGSSSLKWVELAQNDQSQLVLERCVMEPLQAGWIVSGYIAQFDEVAAALRRLLKASGSRTREVAIAMPDSEVITVKIRLPADLGEAEQLRQVVAEVERMTGRPWADVSVDYAVQRQAQAPGQSAEIEILIVAASKEKVQDRLGLAESAGLEPVVVDVEAEASMLAARRLISARHAASASPVVALFQVGTEGASLHVTHRGEIIHALRKSGGGARLTELIAQTYGLEASAAEGQKCQEALPADYGQAVLQPFVRTLADALVSDLDAFLRASSFRKIDSVLLAGGSSVLHGLQDAIQRRIFSDCVRVDPFSGMLLGEAVQGGAFEHAGRAGMLTACGLALRRFHGSC